MTTFLTELQRNFTRIEHTRSDFASHRDNALVWACGEGELEIATYLIKHGANPAYQNDWPLYSACNNGQEHIVEYLLTFDDVRKNAAANRNRSLLIAQVQEFQEIVVRLKTVPTIVSAGPDLEKYGYGFIS